MKFIRLVSCAVMVFGVIFVWEQLRDNVLSNIGTNKVVESVDDVLNTRAIAKDMEPQIKDIPTKANDQDKANEQDKDSGDIGLSFEKGFEMVAKRAMHSVVNVATMQLVDDSEMDIPDIFRNGPLFDDLIKEFFDMPQKRHKTRKANNLGSGFIIRVSNDKIFIVTNNHVVDKAKKIVVFLSDKTELPAEVHAVDPRTDIAVISVSLKGLNLDRSRIVPMEWGDSSKLTEGNFVIAIGNPFGLGSTVTHGIVSAKGRNIPIGKTSLSITEDFIQHSAPINMGNSGGALLDVHGKVVGINNSICSMTGGNIGIGFAIPSNLAKITVDQLIEHKRTFRGWLGAEVHVVDAKQAESVGLIEQKVLDTSRIFGAYVSRVVPGGPAAKAGVKVGDIIIEFNGKRISESCSLQMAVASSGIGSSVKIKVWRQTESEKWHEEELSANIGDFEEAVKNGNIDADSQKNMPNGSEKDANIDSLGITISKLPENYRNDYPSDVNVIVKKIDEEKGTSFYGPIFMPGDGFLFANNKKVSSVSQFKEIMREVENNPENKNKPIPFVVVRDGAQVMIATTLDFSAINSKKK